MAPESVSRTHNDHAHTSTHVHGTRAGEEQPPQVGLASHDLGKRVGVGDVVHKGFDPLAVLTQQVQPESAIRSGQLVHVLRTGQFHLAWHGR